MLQRAAIHVQSSGGEEVTGANVLVAMFAEGWIYGAGTIVAVCFTAIVVTTLYGYFEMRVRQEISNRPLNVSARRLDDPTRSCLKREVPTLPGSRKQADNRGCNQW